MLILKVNFADGIIQSTTGQSFQLNKENIIFMLQIIIFLYLKIKEIKQEWCSEKDISSDFEQEICLENKKILITLYEKNYFDKDSEKFISEQIVKNKYAYLVENFDEEFEKNIKKFFINSDGHFCDDNKNVCLFFSKTYYIYITFDEKR